MSAYPKVSIDTDINKGLCFGCGQNNPIGLKLSFKKVGDAVKTEFTPGRSYQGWPGIVHGGILSCMLDEAMSWAAHGENLNCLTAQMEIRLRQPVKVEQPLVITGQITKKSRKLIEAKATVCLKDGTLIAESKSKQFVVDAESVDAGR